MQAAAISESVVCAWGNEAGRWWVRGQAEDVLTMLRAHPAGPRRLLCLGRNKDGSPLHPLMPSYEGHPLVPYTP